MTCEFDPPRNGGQWVSRSAPKRKGMGIDALVAASFLIDKNNAKNVKWESQRLGYTYKGRRIYNGDAAVNTSPSQRKYRVVVRSRDLDNKIIDAPRVFCHCTCDRFKYVWEVATKRKGASAIRRSNGDLPVVTNPDFSPGACKHVISAIAYIKKHGF